MNAKSFNDALKLAAREVATDDALMFDSLEISEVTISSVTKRRIKRALRYAGKDSHKIPMLKQIIAACIIVCVVSAGIAMSMPDVRAALWDAIVAWFDDHVTVLFENEDSEDVLSNPEYVVLPTYIPDGYVIDKAFENDDLFYIIKDSSGNCAYYYQASTDDVQYFDNTDCEIMQIYLSDDTVGYLLIYDSGRMALTWKDQYIFTIESEHFLVETIVEIAKSVNP